VADTRWEYRLEVVHVAGNDDGPARAEAASTLNALGHDGWEAVGFSPARASGHGLRVETTDYVVLLKRRRRA
jgi:hypothetical protein